MSEDRKHSAAFHILILLNDTSLDFESDSSENLTFSSPFHLGELF